ncbi:MAG: histidine kinase [Sphingomonadaceae bacterium]|nr:histidine kinase [Sphingomonadaceae bacterium]
MVGIATSPETARVPLRMIVASIVGLWVCYFGLTTLRGVIVGIDMESAVLWRRAIVTVAGMGVTFVLWLILRLFDARPMWTKIVAALVVAVPGALLIAQVNQLAFADLESAMIQKLGEKQGINLRRDEAGNVLVDVPGMAPGIGQDGEDPAPATTITLQSAPQGIEKWRPVVDIATSRYFVLLAWAALYLALLAVAQTRLAERRAGAFRQAAKAAELRSLRYQVNPHFLFNTLNSLSALVMTGKGDRAEEMIQNISNFYRHSLADDPTSDVALEEEFDLQRHYLEIEAVRFPDRLKPVFDLPDELADARVPGMILQPLVENSVKYGVAPTRHPVTVTLSAREEYGRLVITVCDNGPGASAKASNGFGIGLANVRDRIEARFGQEATINSGPTPQGYCTELRLPMVKHAL